MTNKRRTNPIERYFRKHTCADLRLLAQIFGGSLQKFAIAWLVAAWARPGTTVILGHDLRFPFRSAS